MESKWLCWLIRAWEKKKEKKFWWKLFTGIFSENFCYNKHDFTESFCHYTTLQQAFEQEMSTWPEGHMVGFEPDHGPVQQVNWLTNKVLPSKEAAVFARRLSKSRGGRQVLPSSATTISKLHVHIKCTSGSRHVPDKVESNKTRRWKATSRNCKYLGFGNIGYFM